MGKPKQPKAPDPMVTAAAQTKTNQETASFNNDLNHYSSYSPYGSEIWTQVGKYESGAPMYRQDIKVAPIAQKTIDQNLENQYNVSKVQDEFLNNAKQTMINPVKSSDLSQYRMNAQQGDTSQQVQQAQDAIYNKQKSMLDPQYRQMGDDLDVKLANQGVNLGSSAYDRAQGNFSRDRDFAYGNARNDAITGGLSAQNQFFNQNMADNQNYNNNVSADSQRKFELNNQPLQQYNALMSGSQVNVPQFQQRNVAQTEAAPIGQYINQDFQNQMSQYNASVASRNGLISAVGNLAGAAPAAIMAYKYKG
jgi:hypothetical protein